MFSKQFKKSTHIWATFARKSVTENFQNLPNLVTLPETKHRNPMQDDGDAKLRHNRKSKFLHRAVNFTTIGNLSSSSLPPPSLISFQKKHETSFKCRETNGWMDDITGRKLISRAAILEWFAWGAE